MEDSSVSDTNSDYQEADYGFYSEMRSDLSQRDSSKKIFQLKKVIEANPTNSTVLCVIEDHKAPVACRSFQSYHEDDTHEVQISIPGYRIVYEDGKHFAEYQVKLCIFDQEFVAWRKYEQFVTFATAFLIFQSENDLKDSRLERIIGAWNAVSLTRYQQQQRKDGSQQKRVQGQLERTEKRPSKKINSSRARDEGDTIDSIFGFERFKQ
eukprot:gene34938-46938_t